MHASARTRLCVVLLGLCASITASTIIVIRNLSPEHLQWKPPELSRVAGDASASTVLNDSVREQDSAHEIDVHVLKERFAIGSRLMLLPKGDGFGTHVLGLLSVLAYCRTKNLTYVHRPWDHVGHCASGVPIADWSAGLERFTGLVEHELRLSDSLGPVPAVTRVQFRGRENDKYFNDNFLASMRERYLSVMPPKTNSNSFNATRDTFRVAVHVRRGDVGESHAGRFTHTTQTLAFMNLVERSIAAEARSKTVTFHVYSEGDTESFSELVNAYDRSRIFLHLGQDLTMTFHDMVSADAIIMAKSGFSYAAALLATGKVFYQPFWIEPLGVWHMLPSR